jgi:CBS domain-containing protein
MIANLRISEIWGRLGGGDIRKGRGQAFWRGGDGWNVALAPENGCWFDHARGVGGGILAQVKESAFNAWPVVGNDGLRGMVRSREIEEAAANNGFERQVSEILRGSPYSTVEGLPHVHPDHSLSLALARMGSSGMNVLPVVSRANLRQLLGVVGLDDILKTYGLANGSEL